MRTWHTTVWMENSTAVIQRIIEKELGSARRACTNSALISCELKPEVNVELFSMEGAIACTVLWTVQGAAIEKGLVWDLSEKCSAVQCRKIVERAQNEKTTEERLVESSDREYYKATIQSCTACTTAKSNQKLKARPNKYSSHFFKMEQQHNKVQN